MPGVFYDAAAGSGKTTHLVELASERDVSNVLFTTFTDNNTGEIRNTFLRVQGRIPGNIDIMPWYTFLLRECVRPFQGTVFGLFGATISGVMLTGCASAPKTRKDDLCHYAFRKGDGTYCVYSDKLAELALTLGLPGTSDKQLITRRTFKGIRGTGLWASGGMLTTTVSIVRPTLKHLGSATAVRRRSLTLPTSCIPICRRQIQQLGTRRSLLTLGSFW